MIGPTPSAPLSSHNNVSLATSLCQSRPSSLFLREDRPADSRSASSPTVADTFNMNDVIALSHMKLALLSRDQRVDSALLLRSILIVNALETHQASQYSDERWLGQMPPSPNDAPTFVPATPKLVPIAEEAEDPIDLDHLFLEPPVVSAFAPISLGAPPGAEVSHVEVVEVGDSDDEDESDDDYASMASSMHSVVSFSMDADDGVVFSPLSSPVQPSFELAFPSSPSAYAVDGDFSDDDDDEVITPPQPVLLDDFKGDSDFGAYDADELEAVEGLQLFGAPSARLP